MAKSDKEIYDEIDKANAAINAGGKYHGMSYEEGVKAALEWILGEAPAPMSDDEE